VERAEEYLYSSANGSFGLDTFPRGLKPQNLLRASDGAAKAAPFQSKDNEMIQNKAAPIQSNDNEMIQNKAAPIQNIGYDSVHSEISPFQSNHELSKNTLNAKETS
jgi:hypothetical protein